MEGKRDKSGINHQKNQIPPAPALPASASSFEEFCYLVTSLEHGALACPLQFLDRHQVNDFVVGFLH